jgi:hypothetical protein
MAVEEKIGVVTDYLNRIGVAVIWLTDGTSGVATRSGSLAGRPSSLRRWSHWRSTIGL